MPQNYRIRFKRGIAPRDIKNLFSMARISLAALRGETQAELACVHEVSEDGREYVIRADTDDGRDLVAMFVGTARRIVGKDCCNVRTLGEADDA